MNASSLSEPALIFARKCIGWRDARRSGVEDFVHTRERGPIEFFEFSDLVVVMDAVRSWCLRHAGSLIIQETPGISAGVCIRGDTFEAGYVSDDLRLSLMAACIAAERMLKKTA